MMSTSFSSTVPYPKEHKNKSLPYQDGGWRHLRPRSYYCILVSEEDGVKSKLEWIYYDKKKLLNRLARLLKEVRLVTRLQA